MDRNDLFSSIVNRPKDKNNRSLVSIDEYKYLSKIATDDRQRDVCWESVGCLSVRGVRVAPYSTSYNPLPEPGDDPKGFTGLVNPTVGKKNDQGKTRMDLIPFGPLEEIAKVLTFGASKYAPDNWKRVEDPVARYEAALLRHITAYKKGEMNDPETGLPHLAHAGCCLMFLMEFTTGSLKPTSK